MEQLEWKRTQEMMKIILAGPLPIGMTTIGSHWLRLQYFREVDSAHSTDGEKTLDVR